MKIVTVKHWGLLTFALVALLIVGCVNKTVTSQDNSIQLSWLKANKQRFAYLIRPVYSSNCSTVVVAGTNRIEGPEINKSLSELIAIVRKSHEEVAKLQMANSRSDESQRGLVISYKVGITRSFSISGPLPDLLKAFETNGSLRSLLLLTSRNQPKSYRILDEIGPSGYYETPLK